MKKNQQKQPTNSTIPLSCSGLPADSRGELARGTGHDDGEGAPQRAATGQRIMHQNSRTLNSDTFGFEKK
jgi:hypothetical protein